MTGKTIWRYEDPSEEESAGKINTVVQVGNKLTAKIKCVGKIRQGDSFNPAIFNLIMDNLLESTITINECKMNDRQIIVCYADDTVLVADSDNLQRLLHKFLITATK